MDKNRIKQALVVRGGWEGHQPVEATDLFIPYLEANGFEVRVEGSPEVYAEEAVMKEIDLVVQCYTMGKAEKEAIAGLRKAIENGTGMAGWHGGIIDSYRESSDYLQLMGAQFAAHEGKHPDECEGGDPDYWVPHTVRMLPAASEHPITQGISDIELVTEHYWVLTDGLLDVLATTTQEVRLWDTFLGRPVTFPAIWTRRWGKGRIFVCTPGHNVDVLENASVKTVIERGLLWAARN